MRQRKIVTDPILGHIDISSVMPIVETPEFQRLGFIKQLGPAHLLFRGATHTRLEHSFGAYQRTIERMNRWVRDGFINFEDARNIEIYSLIHDIGHGPYSHVVEGVTKKILNDNQNGRRVLVKIKNQVEKCGGDFEMIKAMLGEEHPFYAAVRDKNLGTEKLDYLDRDAFHTNFGGRPEINAVASYTYFIDNQVAIDERVIDPAKALQDFYMRMYKEVYLRKGSIIAQRMIQKMMARLLNLGVSEEELWDLDDGDLDYRFKYSGDKTIQAIFTRYYTRKFPKVAVSLRVSGFAQEEKAVEKAIKVFELPEQTLNQLGKIVSPAGLESLEGKIAKAAGLPEESILIVPNMPVSLERFVPRDIKFLTHAGKLESLKTRYPDHFAGMREVAKSYAAFRICVFEEHRERLAGERMAEKIRDSILKEVL